MSRPDPALVRLRTPQGERIIAFTDRVDAAEQVDELNEYAAARRLDVHATLLGGEAYTDRLVDLLPEGTADAGTLERLGYRRAAGEWYAPGETDSGPGLTLADARAQASQAGIWPGTGPTPAYPGGPLILPPTPEPDGDPSGPERPYDLILKSSREQYANVTVTARNREAAINEGLRLDAAGEIAWKEGDFGDVDISVRGEP